MFCNNCSKLNFLYTQKTCMKCKAAVLNNISVLCEQCSATNLTCSVCLKKIHNSKFKISNSGGCKGCGS